ncbi:MAG: ribosome-binding factor A [Isosphaeraceae bacterium]
MRKNCGEVGPEDGVDPRLLARERLFEHQRLRPKASRPKSGGGKSVEADEPGGRKARQLGRQVAETLDALLSGESRDELLGGLRVTSVVPAPDDTHLLVTVTPIAAERPYDPAAIVDHLTRATGWLRTELATAVHRKRVPGLSFRVAPPGGTPVESKNS